MTRFLGWMCYVLAFLCIFIGFLPGGYVFIAIGTAFMNAGKHR